MSGVVSGATEAAAPVMAAILALLGAYVLARFVIGFAPPKFKRAISLKFLAPLGLFAGFVDATGGGGWGPVGTPALLASGRIEPRKTIGSIDTSEFLVALAASLGFLLALGSQGILWSWVAVLLVDGLGVAWASGVTGTAVLAIALVAVASVVRQLGTLPRPDPAVIERVRATEPSLWVGLPLGRRVRLKGPTHPKVGRTGAAVAAQTAAARDGDQGGSDGVDELAERLRGASLIHSNLKVTSN